MSTSANFALSVSRVGPTCTPPEGAVSSTSMALTQAPPVLPTPDYSAGDPIATIAGLLVKSAQQKKKDDDITADIEDKAEDAADAKRVNELEAKADSNLSAGIAGGVSSIAEGGGQLGAGAIGIFGSGGTMAKGGMDAAEGAGKFAGGAGKIVEAGLKYQADMHDVTATKAENEANVHKRAADALRKESDAAAQHIQKVTQLLQDIQSAQAQCEHAALLKM